jgi:hypothetical protein
VVGKIRSTEKWFSNINYSFVVYLILWDYLTLLHNKVEGIRKEAIVA